MTRAESPHSAAAFYHAAQAVLAVEHGIEIRVVSIDADTTGRTYTSLEPLRTYCDLRQPRADFQVYRLNREIKRLRRQVKRLKGGA